MREVGMSEMRIVAIVLLAVTLCGCASTPSLLGNQPQAGAAVAGAPASVSNGPAWRSPNECFYDDGYGRWSPCSIIP